MILIGQLCFSSARWATGLTTVATAGAYVFSRSAITFLDRHDARPPTANPPSSVRSSSPTDVRGRGGDA